MGPFLTSAWGSLDGGPLWTNKSGSCKFDGSPFQMGGGGGTGWIGNSYQIHDYDKHKNKYKPEHNSNECQEFETVSSCRSIMHQLTIAFLQI